MTSLLLFSARHELLILEVTILFPSFAYTTTTACHFGGQNYVHVSMDSLGRFWGFLSLHGKFFSEAFRPWRSLDFFDDENTIETLMLAFLGRLILEAGSKTLFLE